MHGVETEGQIVFRLRTLTDDEISRSLYRKDSRRFLLREFVEPLPEVCVPHGNRGYWKRRYPYWSKSQFFKSSRKVQLAHLALFPFNVWQDHRRWTEPRAYFLAYGCAECRKVLRRRRWRGVGLVVAAICLLTVVPMAIHLWVSQLLAAFVFVLGWMVPTVVGIYVLKPFRDWFARGSMNDGGDEFRVSRPHPGYRAAAEAAGAQYRQGAPITPWERMW